LRNRGGGSIHHDHAGPCDASSDWVSRPHGAEARPKTVRGSNGSPIGAVLEGRASAGSAVEPGRHGRFYGAAEVLVMSRDTTARCRYCGYVYYVEKLAAHEDVCSSRPSSSRRILAKRIRDFPSRTSTPRVLLKPQAASLKSDGLVDKFMGKKSAPPPPPPPPNPNYPSTTGQPSGKGRGNTPKE
jgi:hypothetical protein